MRSREAGKINSNLWYLGRKESGMYLLEGKQESMLISAGISFILGDVLKQIKNFGIDEKKIKSLLILHSHFDHVGTVPYFKRTLPEIDIYAAQRAWDILTMPKAVDTMNAFSRMVAVQEGYEDVLEKYDTEWRNDITGKTVAEGDVLTVDEIEVRIMETPGHSSCSITAYLPSLKTLLPSDAGGIPIDDDIFPSGNSNYSQYEQSLAKMKNLDVDYYCADHYGYITGDEARNYTRQSIEAAGKLRAQIAEIYKKSRDIDSSAKILTEELFRRHPDYFISREIIAGVFGQMVKHIAKSL